MYTNTNTNTNNMIPVLCYYAMIYDSRDFSRRQRRHHLTLRGAARRGTPDVQNEDPAKSGLESKEILNVEGGLSQCTV